MFYRKIIALLMVGIFTGISVFGQDIPTVKKFERARRTAPIALSLNVFGLGIGSFIQGDYKSGFIQVGISSVGYTLLFLGLLGDITRQTKIAEDPIYGDPIYGTVPDWRIKGPLVGIGSSLLLGSVGYGAWRATSFQFDKQFDAFYDINNTSSWPAAGGN